jgi:hypothetical protein
MAERYVNIEVYVSATGQRDTGAEYPVLDWNIVNEKVTYPDMPIGIPKEEPAAISQQYG